MRLDYFKLGWNVFDFIIVLFSIAGRYPLQLFSRLGGSLAEWSARRTRNPAVPDSSPALATCWICSRSS